MSGALHSSGGTFPLTSNLCNTHTSTELVLAVPTSVMANYITIVQGRVRIKIFWFKRLFGYMVQLNTHIPTSTIYYYHPDKERLTLQLNQPHPQPSLKVYSVSLPNHMACVDVKDD